MKKRNVIMVGIVVMGIIAINLTNNIDLKIDNEDFIEAEEIVIEKEEIEEIVIEIDEDFSANIREEEKGLIKDINIDYSFKDNLISNQTIQLQNNPETTAYEGKVIEKEYGYDVYLEIDNFFDFEILKIKVDFDGEVLETFKSSSINLVRHDTVQYLGFNDNNLYIAVIPDMAGANGQNIKFYSLDSKLNIISDINEMGFSENVYEISSDKYVKSLDINLTNSNIVIEYTYCSSFEESLDNQDELANETVYLDLL